MTATTATRIANLRNVYYGSWPIDDDPADDASFEFRSPPATARYSGFPETGDNGLRFQRCGGGRRVIRRRPNDD